MKLFFKIISIVFQPLLLCTYGMIWLINQELFIVFPFSWRLIAVLGTFVFTAVLPLIPIIILMRKGEIKDIFISNREDRTMPYLFSLLAYVFWALFMWRTLGLPPFIWIIGGGTALSVFVLLLINFRWKISAHLSGMGGITAFIISICYHFSINPVLLIVLTFTASALVALSRIELKAHTPGQVLAGYLVGFLSVFIPSMLL